MKTLYQQIPRCSRWFYPEGENVEDESHSDLRARVDHQEEAQGAGHQDYGGIEAGEIEKTKEITLSSRESTSHPQVLRVDKQ